MQNEKPRLKRQIKMGAITLAHLLKYLMEGIYSCKELAQETGLHYVTVLQYTREMHRAGVLHITKWEKCSRGKDQVKIYKFGSKPDAKRQTMTRAESLRKFRAKQKQMRLLQMMAGKQSIPRTQERAAHD